MQTLIMRHGMTKDLWPPSHLYRVRRSSAPPGTSNGPTYSDAETTHACCCHRCPERPPLRNSEARSAPECVDGSSSNLQRELQRIVMQFPFKVCEHGSEMPRISGSLRGASAIIFASADVPTNCGCNVSHVRWVSQSVSATV